MQQHSKGAGQGGPGGGDESLVVGRKDRPQETRKGGGEVKGLGTKLALRETVKFEIRLKGMSAAASGSGGARPPGPRSQRGVPQEEQGLFQPEDCVSPLDSVIWMYQEAMDVLGHPTKKNGKALMPLVHKLACATVEAPVVKGKGRWPFEKAAAKYVPDLCKVIAGSEEDLKAPAVLILGCICDYIERSGAEGAVERLSRMLSSHESVQSVLQETGQTMWKLARGEGSGSAAEGGIAYIKTLAIPVILLESRDVCELLECHLASAVTATMGRYWPTGCNTLDGSSLRRFVKLVSTPGICGNKDEMRRLLNDARLVDVVTKAVQLHHTKESTLRNVKVKGKGWYGVVRQFMCDMITYCEGTEESRDKGHPFAKLLRADLSVLEIDLPRMVQQLRASRRKDQPNDQQGAAEDMPPEPSDLPPHPNGAAGPVKQVANRPADPHSVAHASTSTSLNDNTVGIQTDPPKHTVTQGTSAKERRPRNLPLTNSHSSTSSSSRPRTVSTRDRGRTETGKPVGVSEELDSTDSDEEDDEEDEEGDEGEGMDWAGNDEREEMDEKALRMDKYRRQRTHQCRRLKRKSGAAGDVERLKKRLDDMQKTQSQLEAEKKQLAEQKSALEQQLDEREQDIEALMADLGKLEVYSDAATLQAYEDQIRAFEIEKQQLLQDQQELTDKANTNTQLLQESQRLQEQANKELKELQAREKEQRAVITKTIGRLQAAEVEKRKELEEQKAKLQSAHEKEIKKHQEEIAAYLDQIHKTREEISATKTSLQMEQNKSRKELDEHKAKLQKATERLQAVEAEKQTELEVQKAKLQSLLDKERANHSVQIRNVTDQLEAAKKEANDRQQNVNNLQASIKALEGDIEQLRRNQIDKLEETLKSLTTGAHRFPHAPQRQTATPLRRGDPGPAGPRHPGSVADPS
ncbi:unnamed protein product [Vitrella brassicaformis CCMP3155]|uniref:Uncharacterized protein n=1 Tax=Vitrella brassicaformis (strain CCMP3155) TaxID=1169540 RepID=A0A0G4GWM8_VITBC|nr:unnamed protein product [Vitrella brassicaformis CCMP3155]|eukprot:CEM35386.1 unnamed protein product [Vitrella brassicaformis CCMP3155]